MTNAELSALDEHDRGTVVSWLTEFERSWTEAALAAWVAERLPEPGHPWRRLVLTELVKLDLVRQWQRGRRLPLGSYLERFPQLGTVETIPAGLILAEYQARRQAGATADLSDYARRYPRQADQLARLVRQAEAEPTNGAWAEPEPKSSAPTPGNAPERQLSACAPPPQTAPQVRPQDPSRQLPEIFGRYRILKKLGQGGMGTVYLALDTHLQRQIALKVPDFSAREQREVIERFLREARAAATIQHPNLCPVYDVGEILGVPYMTMAHIAGHLLSEYIRPDRPAPEIRAATLVYHLALALQELHERGIVHRDLKPSNIIVNQRGEPVVMDFGLARRDASGDAPLTHRGVLLGTPGYTSPEQARRDLAAIGPVSDVYSLGVILYELLSGRPPFQGGVLEVLRQVLSAVPPPPSTYWPQLDRHLEAICLQAMAKRPEDRFASMAHFAAALDEFLRSDAAASVIDEAPFEPLSASDSPAATLPSANTVLGEEFGPGSDQLAASAPAEAPSPAVSSPWKTPPPRLVSRSAPTPRPVARAVPMSGPLPPPATPASNDQPSIVLAIPLESGPRSEPSVAGLAAAAGSSFDGHAGRPAQVARPGRRRRGPTLWIGLAAGLPICGLLAWGAMLLLAVPYGTAKIELSDPLAQVYVQLDGETIELARLEQPLRLRAGEHGIAVSGPDYATATEFFVVKPDLEVVVWIKLVRERGGTLPPQPSENNDRESPGLSLTNSLGIKFVLIQPGEFFMGASEFDSAATSDERPQHRVRITRAFYLGRYPVTQAEYRQVMNANPSRFRGLGESAPVDTVSWDDAREFCRKLMQVPAEQAAGRVYRLPTEAEWEYACRAGSKSHYGFDESSEQLGDYAWYDKNSRYSTHPVGSKQPNAWGLYDMQGNVWEWCEDWYDEKYYAQFRSQPAVDPRGPREGILRVFRGGSWDDSAQETRPAHRGRSNPASRLNDRGFRLVLESSGEPASPGTPTPPEK